ncbi:UDP-N-acetylglucosamine 1-carboxyvinyltransferase [Clostridiaceae bacterium NSJ-31]|uniref:UDP-N-acetylglucosamine 1-carboxyvinyltransferase n=1 Tax=Ligaoa zhengdingensis TaxID=2763658 RepID=A0A926E0H1_9FIRM|nr:UDP-N-acetylglucosamine 1-carboxyvinyltransferase [Ligaoa zhengdingensis]MBC8547152.1 UDP-N-acetylglucosamine 1-carboxyvinyltransferase [Ligaoa zhengdingensis]
MQKYLIQGGSRISGEVRVQGAKNSSLPVLAATVVCSGESVLHNCPDLLDTEYAVKILEYLGCQCRREGGSVIVDSSTVSRWEVPDRLMREMRSSIIFLGAIASRCGRCRLSYPGGCEIGQRPIDLHLLALQQMGMQITEDHGYLDCRVDGGFKGANVVLSFPSVGATENVILAAVLAKGTTVITNAAREPEIADLADYLNRCGARIFGAGEGTIRVEGVEKLSACEHTIIPDRIVATTYLTAAAMTSGSVRLTGVDCRHLSSILPLFEEAGCEVRRLPNEVILETSRRPLPIGLIRTMPYPGFPTDAQAPLMAMMTMARGTSVFVENIFENRYKHAAELQRMGAHIKVEGRVAIVEGIQRLHSAEVAATDLRGGAALVLAALAAEGTTEVGRIHYIDRGYDRLEQQLTALGAHIKRLD